MTELNNHIIAELNNSDIRFWSNLEGEISELLREAIAGNSESTANDLWFLRIVCTTRREFLQCLEDISSTAYYEAWKRFEQIEHGLESLTRNPFFDVERFGVTKLKTLVTAWQSLYPYQFFFSPEYVPKRKVCSICSRSVGPWSNCGHKPGIVYCGRECYRLVESVEFLSISLVRNPVQKYSVPFTKDENGNLVDQYNYSSLAFVRQRIKFPYHGFSAEWTEALHPHEMFSALSDDAPCPCESRRSYRACCRDKPGILRPHLQILFDHPPPEDLPNAAFVGYGEKDGAAVQRLRNSNSGTT